jgi:RimJ/RimL family protein N-acetyltransferase
MPADIARLEALLSNPGAFKLVTGLTVADRFCPFDGALTASLRTMRRSSDRERAWWTPRLMILTSASEVIGLIGFKGPPNDGLVEIGYSVSPHHQNQGFATEALCALSAHAFRFSHVRVICAHTQPATSPSTRVLEKSGFQKKGELIDPVDGLVWRWERTPNYS